MFKATAENKAAKAIFYTFEVLAALIGIAYLVFAIIGLADGYGVDTVILYYIVPLITYMPIVYGIGKVIDLLSAKNN